MRQLEGLYGTLRHERVSPVSVGRQSRVAKSKPRSDTSVTRSSIADGKKKSTEYMDIHQVNMNIRQL